MEKADQRKDKTIHAKCEEKGSDMKKKGDQFNRKEYLKRMRLRKSNKILRRRLEMTDLGNKYGKKRVCISQWMCKVVETYSGMQEK